VEERSDACLGLRRSEEVVSGMEALLSGARRRFGIARCLQAAFACCMFVALHCLGQQSSSGHAPPEPGLLFYLSGDHGFKADYAAGGNPDPNYLYDVKILPGGAKDSYLQCGNNQLLSYWAPGNIYSRRGTLAFDWRPRDPVDETEFPVFRVGYGDHSSWDMVWLRIDYNGHGFDAFVTDVNLGRTRVSYTLPSFPKPTAWIHLALAWDENVGIRFYVNGKLAGTKAATGPFDTALDQFGPHSRIIAPTGVESTYNYDRGGDIDELRIYDRMLSDENIAALAKGETPSNIPAVLRNVAQPEWQEEWYTRYGWNNPHHLPAPLPATEITVRKVEIHDAYDLKRWWWKGTDGIPETTWPGVYNRSRLVGRFDYFQLPDWDCYSLSGKSVTFYLPDEPWNHLEVRGGAWGKFDLLTPGEGKPGAVADPDQHDPSRVLARTLFEKSRDSQRITFDLQQPLTGEKVRFTNAEQEWPIQEFGAYYVHPGPEPKGITTLSYIVTANQGTDNPSLTPLTDFIHGRFAADERATMVAMPSIATGAGQAPNRISTATAVSKSNESLPIVHILIPADYRGVQTNVGHGTSYGWDNMHSGLDGIAIDLPPLNIKSTHDESIPMNIQIKDPIWPMRDMLDFSFSVKPGQHYTLWLDTRDRILSNNKSLYLAIASASPEFGTQSLEGMHLRLIFKPYKDAIPEHIADRLTQVRDNYANLVEESVNSRKLNIFNRYYADISDLLRVDPENDLGRKYWNETNREQLKPPFTLPQAPPGVPQWAFLQVEDLRQLKSLINWYIDNRQISNGEFGGGLSDDSDFLNWWPGLAFMGADPDKLKTSLLKTMEAIYAQGMFTNGLSNAQYDELHSYEDGLNVLGQAIMIDYGSPRMLERAMETSRRLEWLTGYNSAGQRQIRSVYFSGTKMAESGVWGWAKDRSYMVFHPALQLVSFNGTPSTRKMVEEIADGFLAHRRPDANGKMTMHFSVNFHTNEDLSSNGAMTPWFMLWAAYKWTGDQKYIAPFNDNGPDSLRTINADALDILHVRDTWGKQLLATNAPNRRTDSGNAGETNEQLAWQLTGDTSQLEKVYATQIETAYDRQFINREGSLWIDRVYFNNGELQRSRLGGVALMRNYIYPGNVVSWRFAAPANDESVAILVPEGTPDHIRILAYNFDDKPVSAQMTGWEIDPGQWEVTQSIQTTADAPLSNTTSRTEPFERSRSLDVTFAPRATTVLELNLKQKGVPYWSRPDLGIDPEDINIESRRMVVMVHSLGAVEAPSAQVILRDRDGKTLATAKTPALAAPTDLQPKVATVFLQLPSKANLEDATVTLQSAGGVPEITLMNNTVHLPPRLAAGSAPSTQ
jgi:hypothetical protein